MISYTCAQLQSCYSEEIITVQYLTGSEEADFFLAELGNVLEINESEEFPDVYYTVLFVCSNLNNYVEDSPDYNQCKACYQQTPSTLSLENVVATGTDQCFSTAYVLVNCNANVTVVNPEDLIQSPSTVLVTQTDLALYVGSVITIEEYPNNCYTVLGPYTENTGCPCDPYTVTNSYKDCECCIPDLPKKYEPRILDPVKEYFRILQSQCDINANVKFANGYYKYFKHVAYGMGVCCDSIDLDKLWLRKKISDLNQLYDPTACIVPPAPEAPLVCEGPTGTVCEPVDPQTINGQLIFD